MALGAALGIVIGVAAAPWPAVAAQTPPPARGTAELNASVPLHAAVPLALLAFGALVAATRRKLG